MSKSNSTEWKPRLTKKNGQEYIFDPVREKFVHRSAEEDVRQWLIFYLNSTLGYPLKCMGVERQIKYNNLVKRFDILIFGSEGNPICLVECKRPSVPIDQSVVDQVSTYNFALKVPYFCLFNGTDLVVCQLDLGRNGFRFLDEMPHYNSLSI